MSQPSGTAPIPERLICLVWNATLTLVAIGFIVAVRRSNVLLSPPEHPRFAVAAALDAGFAAHRFLTFLHIVPAALLIVVMPLQFVRRIRTHHPAYHPWSGRLLLLLVFLLA